MDEEERRFSAMSTDEFDRETEELLDKVGVTNSNVVNNLNSEDDLPVKCKDVVNKDTEQSNNDTSNNIDSTAEINRDDEASVEEDRTMTDTDKSKENQPTADSTTNESDDVNNENESPNVNNENASSDVNNGNESSSAVNPTDESSQDPKSEQSKINEHNTVEENMKALQSDEVNTNSNEEPTEFVQVNTKGDKMDQATDDKDQDTHQDDDEDPIGGTESIEFDERSRSSVTNEKDNTQASTETTEPTETTTVDDSNEKIPLKDTDQEESSMSSTKGVDEELCIIPDTERVISQAEKDAATAQKKSVEDVSSKSGSKEDEKSCENGENNLDTEVESNSALNTVDDVSNQKLEKSKDDWNVASNEIESAKSPADGGQTDDCGVGSKEDATTLDSDSTELIKLDDRIEETCKQCSEQYCSYKCTIKDKETFFCKEQCFKSFISSKTSEKSPPATKQNNKFKVSRDKAREPLIYVRMCHECKKEMMNEERNLSWECMEFCHEDCLVKYQTAIGSSCANCKENVPLPSLGKYCVRFGYDIRQFCSSSCLEDFKKGLKVCSYCQKDISGGVEGFLAPVGDKGQFKDFCSQSCMQKYDQMSNNYAPKKQTAQCDVCSNEKLIRLEIEVEGVVHKLCSEPCFVAFKFANNVSPEQCHMCQKYFEQTTMDYTIYFDDQPHHFCCKTCQNVYIIANRKIVPCQWCKVKKYNFDMIKKNCSTGQVLMMCSINCLALYHVSTNAVSPNRSYPCVMNFQNQFAKTAMNQMTMTQTTSVAEKPPPPVRATPTSASKRTYSTRQNRNSMTSNERFQNDENKNANRSKKYGKNTNFSKNTFPEIQHPPPSTSPQLPIITSVHSLAPQTNGPSTVTRSSAKSTIQAPVTPPPQHQIQQVQTQQTAVQTATQLKPKFVQQFIVKPAPIPEIKNKSTMCKPNMHTKGVSFKPHTSNKENQTDDSLAKTVIVPVPVPIYVPTPMSLFSVPFPVAVPFPLPVPIPIFIPTTRNSANGIMKEIKKIQVKIPTDPFEAELLMMAEMVAGDKKVDNTDSESDDDDNGGNEGGFSPEAVDTSNTFGDDMLQMALKMATELDEPAVDLEGALTANTITASQSHDGGEEEEDNQQMHHHAMMEARGGGRGRKRQSRQPRTGNTGSKRGRRMSSHGDMPMMPPPQTAAPPPPPEPVEKPDANMCLKYTFGVNAWKQWVTTKNAELEKSTLPLKPFKSEILQLTADELNYSLCLFVKEVRKPNGSEYAPDTIYYLCLGIQQYLFENGRIDNIFTDAFYEKFTECLDEVARKFSVLYNDSHYIVTRVEEEHLWESKQLGAHSPHVLLSTLMFFNTKHFNLTTVDEHMQLSFSHIMKHWKRNPNQPGASKGPGSRNVLLRFYPPQSSLGESADANARKKKVYEQQENEENPLRCPVKLYEFYLSKCPESVKTRNDVFYLLPERSCVPDSPVWYSTMALGRNALEKMLHRVKMVKEINVALLTS